MPRFLNYAGKEFASLPYGDTCRDIIQVLLYQGQLQVSQLPHALRSLRGNAATFDDPPTLQRAVQALIQARLMERVPPCTLPPPPSHVHINARKKKAVPKAGSEEEQALQIEAAKLHQRRQFQKVRFDYTGLVTLQALTPPAEPAAPPQSEAAEASGPGSKGKRGSSAAAEPAAKRARGALGAVKKEEPGVNDGADAAVLWRVNYNEFNRRFRDQEIVELVRKQHGDESAAAMAALLAAAAPLDPEDPDSSDYDTSATVSVEDVARASKQLHGNASLTASKAETLLR